MVPTGTGKLENLEKWEGILQSGKSQGKSQEILLKILEKSKQIILEKRKKYWKSQEFWQSVIVKTLQIWYHTLN